MIEHEGIIDQIEGDRARVSINSMSACASCHAKGACTASDMEEKHLDVAIVTGSWEVGQRVIVQIQKHLGLKAVGWAYFYPFLLLMAVLIILLALGLPELRAGVLALLALPPWYLVLYLLRGRMESKFTFSLKNKH